MQKVLIACHVTGNFQIGLERLNYLVDYQPAITHDDLLKQIHGFEGIVINTNIRLDKAVLAQAHALKFIARVGSGLDNIDIRFAKAKGITCINAPEGNRTAVAEHALGLLLALRHNICRSNEEVKKGIWNREENRGAELTGKTIGIIGFGNTGSCFARLLQGFEVRVLAYDKYKTGFGSDYVLESPLEKIQMESDVLSLHVPLTEETQGMVNKVFLGKFKKPVCLINTARGQVINTLDVIAALENGKLSAAALDVLEKEGQNLGAITDWFKKLAAQPNVILTPHIAGWTKESKIKIEEVLLDKIARFQRFIS